jgi:hypothetical protein
MSALVVANLALRFLLELAALGAAGYWGFTAFADWPLQLLAGIGLPLVMAAAWGIFRVPNDGGAPIVLVPPQLRLALEVVFFVLAVTLLHRTGQQRLAWVFLGLVLLNYAIDYDRTIRLLTGRGR